jgi:hypothetical protein
LKVIVVPIPIKPKIVRRNVVINLKMVDKKISNYHLIARLGKLLESKSLYKEG